MSVHIVLMFASLLASAFVYSSPQSPVNHDGCFEENIHYIGLGLPKPGGNNTYGPTGSAEGCQSLCQQTDGCGWFNWEGKMGKCWLKTGKGNQTRKKSGWVTGPRICPTTTRKPIITATTSTTTTTTATIDAGPGFSISGGPSVSEGNIFYAGRPICDDNWNSKGARIFCRMMGYQYGYATYKSAYGQVSSNFSMNNVQCIGNETSLLDCSFTRKANCRSSEGAGVNCSGYLHFSISGGPFANEGNIFNAGRPICDDDWNDTGAGVFCREMGYLGGKATIGSTYGRVSSDFSMDDVHCIGNESSLLDCNYTRKHDCGNGEGAGVICSAVTDFSIRGRSANEGNVYHAGYPIIDDNWNDVGARIFCRMMGYLDGIATNNSTVLIETNVVKDIVQCIGYEKSLLNCNYTTIGGRSKEGAGVNCSDVPYFSISGGPSANEGNIFYGGRPICDDNWNDAAAGVFCREMGYLDGIATSNSTYGRVSTNFSMDNVRCIGNESSLLNCSFSTQFDCGSSEGAGVICSDVAASSVSERSSDNEGNVFYEGKLICDDEWNNSEAGVFVRMMEYLSCHVIIFIDNVSKLNQLIHHTKFM